MVRTASTMLPLGTQAPDFALTNIDGKTVSLSDFRNKKALVVVFMCNHCPYVKHVAPELVRVSNHYMSQEVGFVGISSNDSAEYPDDGPEQMRKEAAAQGYRFPYLFDSDQSVARAYQAACTPDIFLFDANLRLVYRGQLDDSRPKNDRLLTGSDLRRAIDAVLSGQSVSQDQRPSIGCNIKWKQGAEPEYFNPAGVA
ncbi:MAG: thioredoxin family protein [Pirellula sp.]